MWTAGVKDQNVGGQMYKTQMCIFSCRNLSTLKAGNPKYGCSYMFFPHSSHPEIVRTCTGLLTITIIYCIWLQTHSWLSGLYIKGQHSALFWGEMAKVSKKQMKKKKKPNFTHLIVNLNVAIMVDQIYRRKHVLFGCLSCRMSKKNETRWLAESTCSEHC